MRELGAGRSLSYGGRENGGKCRLWLARTDGGRDSLSLSLGKALNLPP